LFSVQSVSNIFGKNNLEVFHVEPQKTHGGSMRYYLGRPGKRPIQPSVVQQLEWEDKFGLSNLDTYRKFAENCKESRRTLLSLLQKLKLEGKKVVGYAATSKSTTVLNYCGIGSDLIECIYDTTPIKQGKYSPGMHIPIRSHAYFKDDEPDYAVLFAWNHAKEIFEKEKEFTERGGKWIVFVPEVKVLESDVYSLSYAV
jgi:methylation protein EvaC